LPNFWEKVAQRAKNVKISTSKKNLRVQKTQNKPLLKPKVSFNKAYFETDYSGENKKNALVKSRLQLLEFGRSD
jgi:hypothetical protein